jgi:hypothetical protein
MASYREKLLAPMSLEELADFMSNADASGSANQAAKTEFLLRQTKLQEAATGATREAAEAERKTARYTRRNAFYMLLSVIVLAIASVANVLVSIFK